MPAPTPSPLWQPRYTLTPAIVRSLLEIEAARAVVDWVQEGFLEVVDASRRGRAYTLSAAYRQFIGNSSAVYRQ